MSYNQVSNPTLAVVEQIAEKEGVDGADLQPPLHSAVDTEALDQVVESMDMGSVEFQYQEYRVTVSSKGEVEIEERMQIG